MPVARTLKEAIPFISKLVERFKANCNQYTSAGSKYNEMALRTEFLNPLLQALGWDVENENAQTQDSREVIYEATVEGDEDRLSRRPDYEMRLARQRKFFLEAKKPSVNIEDDKAAAFQTRRYGFSAGLPISVLANFSHLAIYDCVPIPHETDDPHIARLALYTFEELSIKFAEIWDCISRESVYSGKFDKRYKVDPRGRGTSQFDDFFLKQVEGWRRVFAIDIHKRNPHLTSEDLTYIIQLILNRIVFLRICEDRDLEKYETLRKLDGPRAYTALKNLIEQADKKYDSGLFRLINDPSRGIDIGDDAILSVIAELYYPQSSYTFAVVDPAVLGNIYELFIAHEIVVQPGGDVTILEKPEVKASGGVATTPMFVAHEIVTRTLLPKLSDKSPRALAGRLAVADISCGSGIFLLQAFQLLLDHYLSHYLSEGAQMHKDKIYEVAKGQYRLRLHEKRRILLEHIYGVDIDSQAVEVARFSMLLRLIEDETDASISTHQKMFRERALPCLDNNIVCGNSLVDYARFSKYMPGAPKEILAKVNPLDWEKQFPTIMGKGGFDAIIGNPPYIRIQNMVAYSPEEVKFYQDKGSGYGCAQSDNFDKYSLFVERGLRLLNTDGRLGYIIPHKFFTLRSGEALRGLISRQQVLEQVVYFGSQQVFHGSTTYTCVLILEKHAHKTFMVEQVADLRRWRYGEAGAIAEVGINKIGGARWSFVPDDIKLLFARIRERHTTTLGQVADIFVGVQTSADKIYIRKSTSTTADTITFTDIAGTKWTIERDIVRPSLLDVPLDAFSKPACNSVIVFPYKIIDDEAITYTPAEMRKRFPRALKYLASHKALLGKRNLPKGTASAWYRYGRSQSLTKFNKEKLILPSLSLEPRCAYDDKNVVVTGGGNGPYYLVSPKEGQNLSIYYLQAILCHPVMEAMIRSISSRFRGGYYSHGKQFIEGLPVATFDMDDPESKKKHDEIVQAVKKLIQNSEDIKAATVPKNHDRYARQRAVLLDGLMELIGRLYEISQGDLDIAEGVQIPTT